MQNGTSNAAHDEVKPRAWTKSEDIARRMLNLTFSLSVAQEPLTTEHIINDPRSATPVHLANRASRRLPAIANLWPLSASIFERRPTPTTPKMSSGAGR